MPRNLNELVLSRIQLLHRNTPSYLLEQGILTPWQNCYVTIIYSRKNHSSYNILHAFIFILYNSKTFPFYRKDLQIFHIASNNDDNLFFSITFLFQHISSRLALNRSRLRSSSPSQSIQNEVGSIQIKHYSSNTYYTYLSTVHYTRLRHFTIFPFARPKRSPQMQRRQQLVHFIFNRMGPVYSSAALASCSNLLGFSHDGILISVLLNYPPSST
jgi:hypothetical protein